MISTDTGIACKFPNFALFPNFFLGAMKRAENLLAQPINFSGTNVEGI